VDYYQVIPDPIDLRIIAQKIQSQSYQTLDDMVKDLMLMIQNARFFNKPSSLIYKVQCLCSCVCGFTHRTRYTSYREASVKKGEGLYLRKLTRNEH